LLLKCRLQRSPHDKAHKHAGGRGEEHGATSEPVDEKREADRGYEVPDGKDAVDECLCFLGSDADGVQNEREVVLGTFVSMKFSWMESHRRAYRDQTVAGPLRKEADSENDEESKHVASCLEESNIRACLAGLFFEAQCFLDLFQFDKHDWIVWVAVGMVLDASQSSSNSIDSRSMILTLVIIACASSHRSLLTSHRGDSTIHQKQMIWITLDSA
jgi:hypothetical protein